MSASSFTRDTDTDRLNAMLERSGPSEHVASFLQRFGTKFKDDPVAFKWFEEQIRRGADRYTAAAIGKKKIGAPRVKLVSKTGFIKTQES